MKQLLTICVFITLLFDTLSAQTPTPLVWQALRVRYTQVTPAVRDGRILVSKDRKFGFTNADGEEVIPCTWDCASNFSERFAVVCLREPNQEPTQKVSHYGLIDLDGRVVIPCEWDGLTDILYGVTVARQKSADGYTFALIDTIGVVKALPYNHCGRFSQGLAVAGKGHYVDEVNQMSGRSEKVFSGKCGFITPDGQEAIAFQFDDARPFNKQGWAAVGMQGKYYMKWGFANRKGEVVVPCIYFNVEAFAGGLSLVTKVVAGGKLAYGFINAKGEEVIPCKYDTATGFREANAWVGVTNGDGFSYTLINKQGQSVLPYPVETINEGGHYGLVVVGRRNESGKLVHGIINNAGLVALPFEYEQITVFSERDPATGEWRDGATATKNGTPFSFDISKRQ